MAIDDDITFLERVPTLSLLGRQALRILAIGAETRYVHSGELLFRRGEEADGAYVIQEGRFTLSSKDGDEVTVGPCTLLGEVALFSETRRPATATRARAVDRAADSAASCSFGCWTVSPRRRASCAKFWRRDWIKRRARFPMCARCWTRTSRSNGAPRSAPRVA